MNVTQFYLMSESLSTILVEKGYSKIKSKLNYKLVKKEDCNNIDNSVCIEVKSAKDVLDFLTYLKINLNTTEEVLDNLYFKKEGFHLGQDIYLNLEIS